MLNRVEIEIEAYEKVLNTLEQAKSLVCSNETFSPEYLMGFVASYELTIEYLYDIINEKSRLE